MFVCFKRKTILGLCQNVTKRFKKVSTVEYLCDKKLLTRKSLSQSIAVLKEISPWTFEVRFLLEKLKLKRKKKNHLLIKTLENSTVEYLYDKKLLYKIKNLSQSIAIGERSAIDITLLTSKKFEVRCLLERLKFVQKR